MNYNQLLKELEQASLFELYRLHTLIGHELEKPERILAMRKQLRPGIVVDYFDPTKNHSVAVRITQVRRSRVSAIEIDSGKQWNLPFYMLNLEQTPANVAPEVRGGVDRNSLSVGNTVGFEGRDGETIYGEIIKLNPKRAKVRTADAIWSVYYQSMFPIIEGEQDAPHRIIDMGTLD